MYIVVIPQNKKSHFAVYKTSGQMTYIYGFMMQEMLIAFELNNKMHILHLFFSYLHCELNFRAHIAVNLCYVLTNFAYNNIYNNIIILMTTLETCIQQIVCNLWTVIFYNKALTSSNFKTLKCSLPVLWMLLWNISANSDIENLEQQTVNFNSPCDTQLEKKC